MVRIEAVGRVEAAQIRAARAGAVPDAVPARRALVPLGDGGHARRPRPSGGRADAGFLAHLLASADPTVRPSRLERTRAAADLYAAAAARAP